MGSNTKKKPCTNLQNLHENWSKEIKSENFCYRKVGRAITKWGAIEKKTLDRALKTNPYLGGINKLFVDCKRCRGIKRDSTLDEH